MGNDVLQHRLTERSVATDQDHVAGMSQKSLCEVVHVKVLCKCVLSICKFKLMLLLGVFVKSKWMKWTKSGDVAR